MKLKAVFVGAFSLISVILHAQIQTQPARTQTDQPLNKTFIFKPKVELKRERLLTILPGTCRIRGSYDATTGHVSENIGTIDGRIFFGPSVATRDWTADAYCQVPLPDRAIVKKIAHRGFLLNQNGSIYTQFKRVNRENMSKPHDSWASYKVADILAHLKSGPYSGSSQYPQTYAAINLNHTVDEQRYVYTLQIELHKKAALQQQYGIFLSAVEITYDEIQ